MTNAIPMHAIAALNAAAEADMRALDLWIMSPDATENAHLRINSALREAERRADEKRDAAMNLVPDSAVQNALIYISAKASEMDLARRFSAIRGAVTQRKMRETRLAVEEKAARLKKAKEMRAAFALV